MAVCNYETLTASKASWMQLTRHQLEVMKTVRLCHIYNYLNAGTAMPACDVDTLMADAGILNRLTSYQISVLQAILLCDIGTVLGGGGSGGVLFLSGNGHPEGVVQGNRVGQTYLDLDTGNTYWFAGTVGTNTGWIP